MQLDKCMRKIAALCCWQQRAVVMQVVPILQGVCSQQLLVVSITMVSMQMCPLLLAAVGAAVAAAG
jgi:hypothetical protein